MRIPWVHAGRHEESEAAYPRTMVARWHGAELARSDQGIVVEGNHYFPPEAVDRQYLRESTTHTHCFWKGEASYYDVVVDGTVNRNAAWYYPHPTPAANHIAGYIAFWHGVEVKAAP